MMAICRKDGFVVEFAPAQQMVFDGCLLGWRIAVRSGKQLACVPRDAYHSTSSIQTSIIQEYPRCCTIRRMAKARSLPDGTYFDGRTPEPGDTISARIEPDRHED